MHMAMHLSFPVKQTLINYRAGECCTYMPIIMYFYDSAASCSELSPIESKKNSVDECKHLN